MKPESLFYALTQGQPIKNSQSALKSEFITMLGLFVLALVFLLTALGDFSVLGFPNFYHGRDLNRAFDLYHHQKLLWYGPELTGGGQLPGPFYYFLIGLPLWLFGTYTSVLILQCVMAALAATLVWKFTARYSSDGAILAYFYFIGSPYFIKQLAAPWNPSFLPLFTMICILLLSQLQKNRMLFFGALILGLSLQIHFLHLILLAAVIGALCLEDASLNVRLKKIGCVIGGVILPLIPYFVFRLSERAPSTDSSLMAGVQSLLARGSLEIMPLLTFAKLLFSEGDDFLIAPIILIVLFTFRSAFRQHRFIAIALLLSALPALKVLTHGPFLLRYMYPLLLLLGLVASVSATDFVSKFRKKIYVFLALAAAARFAIHFYNDDQFLRGFSLSVLTVGIATAFMFFKRSERTMFLLLFFLVFSSTNIVGEKIAKFHGERIQKASHLRLNEGEDLLRAIISTSGWSYQQFRERTFMQAGGTHEDYSFFYNFISRQLPSADHPKYDGLLIRSLVPADAVVPAVLEELLSTGVAFCAKEVVVRSFALCFYNFSDPALAVRINNIGYGYDYSQPALFEIKSQNGVNVVGNSQAIFYFNNCNNLEPSCSVFFRVSLTGKRMRVEVFGDPVASPVPSVNPSYAARLEKPALVVICGKKEAAFEVAPSLGYLRKKSTVLAPFDAVFAIPCAKPEGVLLKIERYRIAVQDTIYDWGPPINLAWRPL